MRKCSECKEEKLDNEFSFQNKSINKYVSACKSCMNKRQREKRKNNIEKFRELDKIEYQKTKEKRIFYAKTYRIKYPDRTRETNLKSKYGITQLDYDNKLFEQDNKCAICGRDMIVYGKRFCVDHNHETGTIRGLICDPCNYGLGFYEKHKDKYIKYLNDYPD